MITRTKAPELHLLSILDFFRVAVAPFQGHVRVRVGVHENVEGAVAVEHGEEGHACGDLPENGLDFGLDFGFCFFFCGSGGGFSVAC